MCFFSVKLWHERVLMAKYDFIFKVKKNSKDTITGLKGLRDAEQFL